MSWPKAGLLGTLESPIVLVALQFHVLSIHTNLSRSFLSQVHFEEVHSKEDAAFVKSLKDLFSKAKSAVTSSEEAVDEISPQPRLRLAP